MFPVCLPQNLKLPKNLLKILKSQRKKSHCTLNIIVNIIIVIDCNIISLNYYLFCLYYDNLKEFLFKIIDKMADRYEIGMNSLYYMNSL